MDGVIAPGGLIPAHAGSTGMRFIVGPGTRAHPRSRGEHGFGIFRPVFDHGSSPLTRGAPRTVYENDYLEGLIPAHAGSTLGLSTSSQSNGAHPRSRGEHRAYPIPKAIQTGSSPLTRGARARGGGGE